jgi:hypothetical protein
MSFDFSNLYLCQHTFCPTTAGTKVTSIVGEQEAWPFAFPYPTVFNGPASQTPVRHPWPSRSPFPNPNSNPNSNSNPNPNSNPNSNSLYPCSPVLSFLGLHRKLWCGSLALSRFHSCTRAQRLPQPSTLPLTVDSATQPPAGTHASAW